MTNQDLYRAIGDAEDTFLLECEEPIVRPIPKRFGIIAALVALMLTACAAPAIARNFQALQAGNIIPGKFDHTIPVEILGNGTVVKTEAVSTSGSMALQIDRSDDAPNTLEEYYIPAELTDLCTIESCTIDETCLKMEFSRKGPKGSTLYDILYRQYVIPESEEITIDRFLDQGIYTQTAKTIGDTSFIELRGAVPFDKVTGYCDGQKLSTFAAPGTGVKGSFLFWSDGRYVYCVKMPILPPHTGSQAVEDVISSLTKVSDISQYLSEA